MPPWALALLLAHTAPGGAAAGACPASARVEVNLPAWRASLEKADTPQRRDDLLAEVKLSLDLPETEAAAAREPRLALGAIDDTAVLLEAGARPHHVVEVSYRVESDEDQPTIHLVQVLRPLDARAFCALGTSLSRRDEPPGKLVSYALTFVPLLSAETKAIQVETTRGAARQSETRREYWVARGLELRKVFDEALGEMTSVAGGGATTTTVATVALSGGFPRHIELSEIKKRGGCEVRAGDTPCDDTGAATKTTFVYDGARFVRRLVNDDNKK